MQWCNIRYSTLHNLQTVNTRVVFFLIDTNILHDSKFYLPYIVEPGTLLVIIESPQSCNNGIQENYSCDIYPVRQGVFLTELLF